MADCGEVIKGLEAVKETLADMRDRQGVTWVQDALTLLKAQEPRVLTLEEVKASKGDDMYLEISTRTDEIPYITAATLDGVGTKGVVFYCSHFDFVAYNRRLYGWRCWTSRPTDEQREAVKWDE